MTRCTIEEAQRVIALLSPVAHGQGYMLALYGSVLTRGYGRDIDVIAVPWRPGAASPEELIRVLCTQGFESPEVGRRGAMSTYATVIIEKQTGLPIDLQIREVPRLLTI